jgi:hypothetical protein
MKKHLLKTGAALLVMVIMVFTSCDEVENVDSKVDFTSHNNNPAFFVDNHSTQRLIAFKGNLAQANLLGGIPAGAEYHAIRRNPTHFSRTEAFPVILITEEQFIEQKNNLSVLTNTPFTRIFVFYNHGLENPARYTISGSVGGRHSLLVQNPTRFDVELRLNGVGGETIGFVPGQMLVTRLYLTDGSHNIFPVFRFFNPVRGVVSTIFPQNNAGNPWFIPIAATGTTPQNLTINVQNALDQTAINQTLGAAWLIVRNQTQGAVAVQRGVSFITDAMGEEYFNPGIDRIIQIDMPRALDNANAFAGETIVSGLRIGPHGAMVDVTNGTPGNTTFTLETDTQYVITVTGDHNAGTLNAVINLSGTLLTLNDILPD